MTSPYEIFIKRSAEKELAQLPQLDRRRVVQAIQTLAAAPRPRGCEKLSGRNAYRVRVGVYRIVYTVADDRLVVEVIKVGHRREIHRRR